MDRPLTSPSCPPQRMAELDLLRCLAILMVVTLHTAAPLLSNPALVGTPAWYFCLLLDPFSRTGVPLFFMLSGFLLLRDPRTLQVAPFYRRRIPRLAVPLVLWNLIYALADAWSARRPFSPLEYLEGLLDRGCYYHIWFIYLLLGLYLLAPFLKRIVDHASGREVLVLIGIILLPTTLLPLLEGLSPIPVRPIPAMLEGLTGYFLLGWLLGSQPPRPSLRPLIYLGGVLGWVWDVWANWASASPAGVPLPSASGYRLSHYLCAAALFVWLRARYERRPVPAAPLWARLSPLVFGVYWVHPLILTWTSRLTGANWTPGQCLLFQFPATLLLSLPAAWLLSRTPVLRRVLM